MSHQKKTIPFFLAGVHLFEIQNEIKFFIEFEKRIASKILSKKAKLVRIIYVLIFLKDFFTLSKIPD